MVIHTATDCNCAKKVNSVDVFLPNFSGLLPLINILRDSYQGKWYFKARLRSVFNVVQSAQCFLFMNHGDSKT